jgi:DNA-binding transcriptional regulator YdaS (Cro superfamily)
MDLRLYMRIQNIKVNAMADSLGVSLGTMHNIFNGREPRLSLALKIEEVTDGEVSCEDLLAYVKSKRHEGQDYE